MALWERRVDGPVAWLTFTNPPRNLMPFVGMTELADHLTEVGEDPSVSVVVLAGGVDGYFVAHADTTAIADLGRGDEVEGDPLDWYRALSLMESIPPVVVAAVDGQAWGGGCEIGLAATIRLASERAHFALPEVAVGSIPGAGGTQRLPRLVGAGNAAGMILTGNPIDAPRALAIGLVQAVLPTEGFTDHVSAWVADLARHPRSGLVAAKRAIVEGMRLSFDDGLGLSIGLYRDLQASDETQRLRAESHRAAEEGDGHGFGDIRPPERA